MIFSTKQGVVFQADAEDAGLIARFSWYASKAGASRTRYIVAHGPLHNGKRAWLQLHRLITQCPPDMTVDHINGDGMDNRRANLRVCSLAENIRNVPKTWPGSSRFKGVSLSQQRLTNGLPPWKAVIRHDKKAHFLGYHASEQLAAQAYDRACVALHGEFARPNIAA